MKYLLVLTALLCCLTLQAQNAEKSLKVEMLEVEGYTISNEVFAYIKSGNSPTHGVTIDLKGTPRENGSTVTSAKLNFYSKGDPRLNQKPAFDKNRKRILANYPIEAFSGIVETLKLKQKKKTSLTFQYVLNQQKNGVKAFLSFSEEY
jgi:hypothetical protein